MTTKIESKAEFMKAVETTEDEFRHINRVVLSSDKVKSKTKRNTSKQSENNVIINYDIHKDDEELVVLIKNEINMSQITLQDIYNSNLFETDSQGYNLYYSLGKHRQITEGRLKLWATVLGKQIVVLIEDKKD